MGDRNRLYRILGRKGTMMLVAAMTGTIVLTGCGSSASTASSASGTAAAESASGMTAEAGSETASEDTDTADTEEASAPVTTLNQIDNTKWQYNEEDDVYYQLGILYCANPADETYEKLAVFVPGAYMNAADNGDGTWTCELYTTATAGSSEYTAETAPIAFTINTPGYVAAQAMTSYDDNIGYGSITDYTGEGLVLVVPGCRGREQGAPAGVTDLKAAIRYLRYNEGSIAGDMDRIFSLGMSGGGAQSALVGVTGDSELYTDYLNAIGAVQGVSDAVAGSMCWCPITGLDSADEAYEWQMGNTRTSLSDEELTLSNDLTAAFADYINQLGLTDDEGNELTLEQSDDGRYQAGSYYEFIKSVVEESLNNFLSDTTFPYDADSASGKGGFGGGQGGPGGGGGFGGPDGATADFAGPDKAAGDTAADGGTDNGIAQDIDENGGAAGEGGIEAQDQISRGGVSTVEGVTLSGTYETAQDYIDALNANGEWISYDADTNTAEITSLEDFSAAVKLAGKSLGAFDELDEGQGENVLFGYGDGDGAHFDSILAEILEKEGSDYADDYAEDLAKTDEQGRTAQERLEMYSPLYYLMEGSEGFETSTVAQYFRINTGLWQSDTALTSEVNLAQALKNYGSDVEFTTVWGLQHTEAERTGDSTQNFITWVNECVAR